MKIFISHSSKDKEVAVFLKSFLESMSIDITAFCSSSFGAIKHGTNYVQAIEHELDNCDQFIALVSDNYIGSQYCMIELGYAYAKLVHEEAAIVKPLTFPGCENLLDNSPLSHLEHYPLLNPQTYMEFVLELQEKGLKVSIGNANIRSFVRNATNICLRSMDVFNQADLISCCSDPKNPDAIRCTRNDDSIVVNYNLFSNGKNRKPDFISTVFHFYNTIDLYSYYKAETSLTLHCEIENYTDSLKAIQVEFQAEGNRGICQPFVYDLNGKITIIDIPISSMAKYNYDLKKLSNICFVVLKDSFIENEGTYMIKNIRIAGIAE
ncbi:MAG: toll/interleukin-1 receptor domain-containing protein [Clostridia bacterium]|nr:toll/interleukin-1 receptor domain-containing protein [Clostridia bacterium]